MVVKSDDSIWFTDPPYGIMSDYEGNKAEPESATTFFLVEGSPARSGSSADDFILAVRARLWPDEKQLYIVDFGQVGA